MNTFQPDYRHILDSAQNREAVRLPLYEHIISDAKMEEILDIKFSPLFGGDDRDLHEYFRIYNNFFKDYGYDTVSFECCIGGAMPGAGALGDCRHAPVIRDMQDFLRYPWDEIPQIYFDKFSRYFHALRDEMPAGMKAVGGVGNGIFECVEDLVGYQNLCYISADDEELYEGLFRKVGQTNLRIWTRFMQEFGDIFCVLRFGDDLGYRSNTMLSADDIRTHIFPQYKPIVDLVHSYGKPFLLHSCGNIFKIMDSLIDEVGIDAKHSNEDPIAPFPVWVEKYGDRIGNFGGLDLDVVCHSSRAQLKEYITDVVRQCRGHGGFAIGTGNSIPDYVPAESYLNMVEIVRELRGDFAG